MHNLQVPILAFDPSNVNLGVCVGVFDCDTKVFTVIGVTTFSVKKLVNEKLDGEVEILGERSRQVKFIRNLTTNLINFHEPTFIITEEPMLGKNPKSLGNQWEGISALRHGVLDAKVNTDLELVSAGTIKANLGIPGNDGDKNRITLALLEKIKDGSLVYLDETHTPNNQDEHGNDAVAIALCKVSQWTELL